MSKVIGVLIGLSVLALSFFLFLFFSGRIDIDRRLINTETADVNYGGLGGSLSTKSDNNLLRSIASSLRGINESEKESGNIGGGVR